MVLSDKCQTEIMLKATYSECDTFYILYYSFSCLSQVHMIAMYEPEGSVRGFQQNPSVIPDVEVELFILFFIPLYYPACCTISYIYFFVNIYNTVESTI